MSDDVVFCYEDEECAIAQRLMEEHDLSYLAMVDREMHIHLLARSRRAWSSARKSCARPSAPAAPFTACRPLKHARFLHPSDDLGWRDDFDSLI